ncbi:MAG: TrmB family transcriptional regulator [Candidatus Taylorbacteria bacterium]|nr:TrmB family transcriptional regulator [Candidatus Taylorbacteria bacterium]
MYDVFKLTKTELRIFEYVRDFTKIKESCVVSVSGISKTLKIPRMTVHDAVQSLNKRGLIEYVMNNKIKGYKLADKEKVLGRINILYHGEKNSIHISRDIVITKGIDACHAVWRKIADLKAGEKVVSIQPNESIKYTFKKLGINSLYPSNDALNTKGIVSEALVNETCYEFVYTILKKERGKEFALNELRKFAPRPSNNASIDKKYLQTPTELFFIRGTAYLVNWKDEVSIEIHNETIMNFLYELYTLARGYGRKIRQKEFIEELVNKIERRDS